MFRLRDVAAAHENQHAGALSPGADLVVLVSRGKRGALRIRDAELPAFDAVLASGETIVVSVEHGALSFERPKIESHDGQAASPLFRATRRIVVRGAAAIALRGGEWGSSELRVDYRARAERRLLRGTPDKPLEVAFLASE